jgi:hypothetical protein
LLPAAGLLQFVRFYVCNTLTWLYIFSYF